MFTIKHISPDGGETIIAANDVSYSPQIGDYLGSQLSGRSYSPATLWHSKTGGNLEPMTGGTAYVMNESGATVAKYDLNNGMPVGIVGSVGGINQGMGSNYGLTAAEAARAA
jgi:hypothetical protein